MSRSNDSSDLQLARFAKYRHLGEVEPFFAKRKEKKSQKQLEEEMFAAQQQINYELDLRRECGEADHHG